MGPHHPPQHEVPYKTGRSRRRSALIAWLVHKVPSTDPPVISTFSFSPNTGLKYILSSKNYILNAAINIYMPKAVTDQQTPTVEGGSEMMGTGNALMMLREEYKE